VAPTTKPTPKTWAEAKAATEWAFTLEKMVGAHPAHHLAHGFFVSLDLNAETIVRLDDLEFTNDLVWHFFTSCCNFCLN
jgi:hypothetical protein